MPGASHSQREAVRADRLNRVGEEGTSKSRCLSVSMAQKLMEHNGTSELGWAVPKEREKSR
jgi:hypothetical protein